MTPSHRVIVTTLFTVMWMTSFGQEKFDLFSFTSPPGWVRSGNADAIIFTRYNETKSQFCVIGIFDSRAGTGDPLAEYTLEWNDLIKKGKKVDAPAAPQVQTANGWTIVSGAAPVESADPPFNVLLMTFMGFGRVASIEVNVSDDQFMEEVKDFLASVQLVAPPPPTVGTPEAVQTVSSGNGGAVVGMWRSICNDKSSSTAITNASGTGFSMISSSTGGMRVKHLLFFADGSVCSYVGLHGFANKASLRAGDPNSWGAYTVNQSEGTMKFDGLSTTYNFTLGSGKLTYDRCVYDQLPWIEGLRLEGTYTVEPDAAVYKEKGMNAEPVIQFNKGGQFTDTGAVYYLNHIYLSATDMSDNKYGSGTYDIRQHTLTLQFEDGRVYQYTYLNFDGNVANPAQLSIAMKLLSRK